MSFKIDNAQLIINPKDERLYKRCSKVKDVTTAETYAIVQKMIQIQKETGGIGLAANQIGIDRQIMTVYNDASDEIVEFINPRIVESSCDDKDIDFQQEGCLSHPGILCDVGRYKSLEFYARQIRSGNRDIRFHISGLVCRIFQHEFCHLNGLLITDMGPFTRSIVPTAAQTQLLQSNAQFEQKDFVIE